MSGAGLIGVPQGGAQDFNTVGTSPLEAWLMAGIGNAVSQTAGAPAAATMWAIPFMSPHRASARLDRIAFNLTTGAANSAARVGIYAATSETNLYPAALVVDGGTNVTTAGAEGVKAATIDVPLRPSWLHWAVYLCQATAPQIRVCSVGGWSSILGISSAMGTAPNIGISVAQAYGSLPNPFTAGGAFFVAVPIPVIAMRFSA